MQKKSEAQINAGFMQPSIRSNTRPSSENGLMGFEAGNLDHTLRFADRFGAVGDEKGAKLHQTIFEEEIPHVRFALRWFRVWTGTEDFASWRRHLPAPLSPMVMRGRPIDRSGRLRAGMTAHFIDELTEWEPT